MTRTEGAFCISVGGMMTGRDHDCSGWSRLRFFVPVKLKSVLTKYGELKSFRLLREDEDNCSQLFMIEYYDIRAGESAWNSLNGRVVDSMKLRLIQRDVLRDECSGPRDLEKEETGGLEGHLGGEHAAEPKTPTASTYLSQSQTISNSSDTPFPLLNDVDSCHQHYDRERSNCDSLDRGSAVDGYTFSIAGRQKPSFHYPLDSHSSITTDQTPSVDPPHIRGSGFAPDQFGRRGSNNLFDANRPRGPYKRVDVNHMRTSSTNTNGFDDPQVGPYVVDGVTGGATDLYNTSYPSAQPHYGHDYFTHADRTRCPHSRPCLRCALRCIGIR
ncbi:hypothetical protein BS17DRAFT_455339 [Gyrodon lividus]|nr:hypothetical protein BS17DRAFT_455339 [Gyrodon lividus]